jgi:hypothetical protein
MAHYGVLVGVALLVLVTAVAFLLARRAERSIERYREESHDRFLGRGNE